MYILHTFVHEISSGKLLLQTHHTHMVCKNGIPLSAQALHVQMHTHTHTHFVCRHGVNDAYTGGLSSHSLILLVLFFVRFLSPSPLPPDGAHGELLLRFLRWLAEFPFRHVGLEFAQPESSSPDAEQVKAFVPLTDEGYALLETYLKTQEYHSRLLATASIERSVLVARRVSLWCRR